LLSKTPKRKSVASGMNEAVLFTINSGSTYANGIYVLRSEETLGNIKKVVFGCLSSENRVGKLAQCLVLAFGLDKRNFLTFSIRS
jgi:hypothetical protein